MTTTPSSPPTLADWRRLALDLAEALGAESAPDALLRDEVVGGLLAERDDLLAAEDQHPPTFHVRPVWGFRRNGRWRWHYQSQAAQTAHALARGISYRPDADIGPITKQWRWGAREANGEIVIPESEPLTDRAHAIAMAKRFAAGVGGRVVDDETGEEL